MVDDMPSSGTVALVTDPQWRGRQGVCCWRASVHAAFAEGGFDVHELAWSPPEPERAPADTGATPAARPPSALRTGLRIGRRIGWAIGYGSYRVVRRITRPVLLPLVEAIRDLRRRSRPTEDEAEQAPVPRPDAEPVDPRLAELVGHRLVIAESPEAAQAAARSGVRRSAVWLLAVPPERSAAGEPASWAAPLRAVVQQIGGLITDSLDAAGVLERVTGPIRTVVFPPMATDRMCPVCAFADATGPLDPFPTDVPGHLRLWNALLGEEAVPVSVSRTPTPYAYAVWRFRGAAGPWLPDERPDWGDAITTTLDADPAPDWSMQAQVDGVRALIASTPDRTDAAYAGSGSGAPDRGVQDQPVKVRFFGNDMRFVRDLAFELSRRADLEVVIDEWRTAGARNDGITENLARGANVLVAEWARANAAWLAEAKRPDQRLIVRLHRAELDNADPDRIAIDAVDAVVYVSPVVGRRISTDLGWPAERLVYIPNHVDIGRMDRPKYPGAHFTLGLLGAVPGRKRFDLALDLLARVRAEDPRYTLLVRTQQGWADMPSWEQAAERHELQRSLERVEKDPLLRGAVAFDSYGADVAAWFRKVGHILSLSDVEGSHQALAEGMASGAVPILRGWPGSAELYGSEWICADPAAAVARLLQDADDDQWRDRSDRAKTCVRERFDPATVAGAWHDLLTGRLDGARSRFGGDGSDGDRAVASTTP